MGNSSYGEFTFGKMIKRLAICGDVHGDVPQMKYLYKQALIFEADAILILGDFGYWEHQKSGIYFLNYVASRAEATGIPFYFIPGNHENHTLLNRRYLGRHDVGRDTQSVEKQLEFVEKKLGPWIPEQSEEGFWKVRDGVWYIPRPCVWSWNSVRFAALGGAFSIDVNRRKAGLSWWPEEMIESDEANVLSDMGKVDIFLSHDVPLEYDVEKEYIIRGEPFCKADQQTRRNRSLLSRAVKFTHPDYHFSGHYHIRANGRYMLDDGHEVVMNVLNRDGTQQESYTVIDLV